MKIVHINDANWDGDSWAFGMSDIYSLSIFMLEGLLVMDASFMGFNVLY
jgi:hypothetical protein